MPINRILDHIINQLPKINIEQLDFESIKTTTPGEAESLKKIKALLGKYKDLSEHLERMEARSQGVLDTMLDALIVINDQGIIQSANKATETIFGYRADELIGKNIKMLIPDPYHSEDDGYLSNYRKSGNRKVIDIGREVTAKRKNGTTFPASLAVGEMAIGKERFFTGTIKDISLQKKAEEELNERNKALEEQAWIKSQLTTVASIAQGATDIMTLSKEVLSHIAKTFEIGHGAFYLREETDEGNYKDSLKLQGTYAFKSRKNLSKIIEFGEGIVGQSAYEKLPIHLTKVPSDYIQIGSALGEAPPLNILAQPIVFEKQLLGVLEIASFHTITENQQNLMQQIADSLGVVVNSVLARQKTEKLLEASQEMTKQLKAQQEELEQSNIELKEKTLRLEESEKDLKSQQEELKVANEELEENTVKLEEKQKDLEISHVDLEKAKQDVDKKAQELEVASRYKSQFLANMSHELRSPLNSLLLLSGKLKDNEDKNLTNDQVKMLECIYGGGQDLLYLINDILDISKVESGMLELQVEPFNLEEIATALKEKFIPLSQEKKVTFSVTCEESLPKMVSDAFRIQQVLKNLLSNAFKFTEGGTVHLTISKLKKRVMFKNKNLTMDNCVAFAVSDTGVGIPGDKLDLIFEAFKQVDGTTSRKYGGTGLGLSISQELSKLLEGEIHVESDLGKGSTFTLYLPLKISGKAMEMATLKDEISSRKNGYTTSEPHNQNNVILIALNDNQVRESLKQYVNGQGYEAIFASDLNSIQKYAALYHPQAVIINKEDNSQITSFLQTRSIPFHCVQPVSSAEQDIDSGILDHIVNDFAQALTLIEKEKHVSIRKVLVAEDNPTTIKQIKDAIENPKTEVTIVTMGEEAIDRLMETSYDCCVLDFQLLDMTAIELLRKIATLDEIKLPPLIINTCRDLTKDEYILLKQYADSIIIKGPYSEDRLSMEVGRFLDSLHQSSSGHISQRSEIKKEDLSHKEFLAGKKILIVDDDIRNTLALSTVFKKFNMDILIADNGELAIEKLHEQKNIDLIIMDVMMPVKDGYDTIKDIRYDPRYESVPIIAITASTMPEVKAKCIQLGANDFLTKPVDLEALFQVMKLWLRNHERRAI